MANESVFGINEMAELAISARKAGWLPGEFGALANQHGHLSDMHDVLVGHAEIRHIEHFIDGSAPAEEVLELSQGLHTPPAELFVHRHDQLGELRLERRGQLLFINGKRVGFHVLGLSPEMYMTSSQLAERLAQTAKGKIVLNRNFAEFLCKNPYLIPQRWWGCTFFFPGTVYREKHDFEPGDSWDTIPQEMRNEYVPAFEYHGPRSLFCSEVNLVRTGGDQEGSVMSILGPVLPVLE